MRNPARRLIPALLCCIVATAAAPAPPNDDLTILRHLRPAQRENLFVVRRDGEVRTIAYDSADPPRELAAAPPDPPTLAPVRAQPVRRLAVVRPLPPLVLPPPPALHFERAHLVPSTPGLLAVAGGRLFVPTALMPKPPLRPVAPAAERDLAWLYAHRFETAGGVGNVPGVPVRSQVSSPFDIDSGAFHGVRAVNGFSAVRVSVSIPCGIRHFVTGPGYNEVTGKQGIVDQETGYIYIGGWGAGPRGVSVDAGLQKSSAQAESDDYAFYWKFASNRPITAEERFPCGGPPVVLELYAVSDSLLVFSATGTTGDGRTRTFTAVQQTRPEDGWFPAGGSQDDGIILKRIVSIAQPYSWHRRSGIGRSDRFVSGSDFGIANPHDLTPRIVWGQCELGRVVPPAIVPRYQQWTAADTWHSSVPGIYTDWPPLGVFRRSDGACDATGIYLRA